MSRSKSLARYDSLKKATVRDESGHRAGRLRRQHWPERAGIE
jgi:hypothetical protein